MPLTTNFNRVKEPRGFIKVIEFLIAILAFSTTAGYNSGFTVSLSFSCENGTDSQHVVAKFAYSFSEYKTSYGGVECKTSPPLPPKKNGKVDLSSSLKSSSEFFVFVGVISFLYCIVAMVYYVCFEDPAKYGPGGTGKDIKSFATVDFAVTVLLTLFWFCASAAWAAGLSKLKDETVAGDYCQALKSTGLIMAPCSVTDKANYAGITISVLFGFLCCFLWAANVWFVFKETVWHKEPEATINAEQPESEIPRQEVPGEAVP